MRSLRYLNTVLTMIAVLLTLHLWILWFGPAGRHASVVSTAQAAPRKAGIPNSGAQRYEMVAQLKQINAKTDQLVQLFKSGKAKVQVSDSSSKGREGKTRL